MYKVLYKFHFEKEKENNTTYTYIEIWFVNMILALSFTVLAVQRKMDCCCCYCFIFFLILFYTVLKMRYLESERSTNKHTSSCLLLSQLWYFIDKAFYLQRKVDFSRRFLYLSTLYVYQNRVLFYTDFNVEMSLYFIFQANRYR